MDIVIESLEVHCKGTRSYKSFACVERQFCVNVKTHFVREVLTARYAGTASAHIAPILYESVYASRSGFGCKDMRVKVKKSKLYL